MHTPSDQNVSRKSLKTLLWPMLLVLPLVACGGAGSGGEENDQDNGGNPPPTMGSAPENRYAPHEVDLYAWSHSNADANEDSAVADEQVRASTHYRARVALTSEADQYTDSFVYMTLPRSGRAKEGYSHEDGAEFADSANLTMSWTSFLYNDDTWLELELLNGQTIESLDQVTIRPTTLDFELEWVAEDRVRIKVPYHADGQRFSVEFEPDLVTSYNNLEGNTGTLTEGPDGARVHTEPRNAMLVFAEPTLSEALQRDWIPGDEDGEIYYPEAGEVDNLDAVDADIIYFKPGTYYFPWNYHARLPGRVRWVYLAPGAYVKGALEFAGSRAEYKVTGYGVLSGEKYVYEADTNTAGGHEAYTHRSDSQSDCHGSCVKMLRFSSGSSNQTLTIQGVTINEPPYHSFVIYGDAGSFQTQVSGYKQMGAWYWQTDGIELYDNGRLSNSFFHANDDVFKLYHSNLLIDDVVVWKSENGPVFQWGWESRHIENIYVQNIDIIHNRLYWKDQKHNTCLINSARAWWDVNADNTADPDATVANIHLENIRSEGMNLCAMRLYAQSNWDNIHIDGLEIEAWNDLPLSAQESQFEALWNEARTETVTVGEGDNGLRLTNYIVDRQPVTRAADNWRADQLGRLNFSAGLWDSWSATSERETQCTAQTIDMTVAETLEAGQSTELMASASSGLPVRFYLLNGDGSVDGTTLTAGHQSNALTLAAVQDGDTTFCSSRVTAELSVTGAEGVAPGPRWMGASWEGWSPGNLPMEWDGDSEFVVTVTLDAGDHAFKFTDTEDWSGDDWADSTGLTGTAKLTTGGGPNIDFTLETGGAYEIRFDPYSLDYAITPVE